MDKRLIWLAIGSFAMSTVGFVFSSLLPAIAGDAHVSIPVAGYLIMAFSLAYAIGAPVLSALAGEIDRRRVLAATMLVFVAGNIIAAMSSSFAGLLAAQVVMGMSAGLYAATAQATAVSLAGPEHRARAIAVVVGGTTFAVALGAPIGSLIATMWGWRGTFVAIALLGISCAAILWVRLPRGSRGIKLTLAERFTAIARPGILPSLLVTLLYLAGGFTVISYIAPLALEGAGLPEIALPGMLLAFGVGAVVGNLSSGYLADRIGATRMVVISLLMSSGFCIAIALTLKLLPHHVAGPVLIALMVPWGIIGWAFPPAQASRIVGFGPEIAHLTLSLNASALYFGIAFGTVIGGRVLEFARPSDLGLVAAAFPLVALAVLVASGRSIRLAAAR
ncbi:putative MFS family arabinose efflux permease [Aminobacter aminovorans]|uniref:Purine efflux pump PbuE n=1 Tax=Aminobacter aminovorans TaxID=83263 RepID=A0A380WJ31_AMIAI|nr:MFS transporter [Aminobacter aminovorans]TCS29156.1 putative MFS family arabinose efflux permease [Aminobacter aminovorans]SUU89009.1 Purine efflux pump PbuE [Aminobacter aminovorans]